VQDRFAETRFGRLHYLHGGRHGGAAPALVLLHSNGGSAHDFEMVFDRLVRSFEVFAWDMPGQGDSDPIPRHFTIADYAAALVAFLDAVGVAKASILGASVGGAICVAVGARARERVQRLFIVECPCRSEAEWQRQWPRIEANFGQPVQSRATVAPRVREVADAFIERWNIDRSKAGAKAMTSVMWALRQYDAEADLAQLDPGAMVIYGETGPTLASRDAFTAPLRDAEVVVMSGCGHFPMFDAPDAFCDLVERGATPAG
jgi:pimeloyl-ACP methyl ester carboxylesterase